MTILVSGWHICTACQKDSFYMCYTCPYSVCKKCVRNSEYVVVRENKGFCGICMKTITLIENAAAEANTEKVQVDFDDQGSWEYLFKIYWVSLKEKLSLSLVDLTKARNPWKSSTSKRKITSRLDDGSSPRAYESDELLDFVRFMKNGDVSVLSRCDVQTLVLEYAFMRLFGKERVDRLEMLKLIDSHFLDQERSPVRYTSAGGVTETMSFQVDDRLNMSEQHQEGESQQLSTIDDLDLNLIWLYGDPDGKIHGPFSLMNLRQWNASGYFPPELRIWRLGEQQRGCGENESRKSFAWTEPDKLSLSLATFPGNSNTNYRKDGMLVKQRQMKRTLAIKNDVGLTGAAEKQVTATVQSCGKNWNAATPSSASNVRDSNSGLVSFTDNQEIDFLDLFSPTLKINFASDTMDWKPIVTVPDECDESMSDLLAEVEVMEFQKSLSSPTSTFRGSGELLNTPSTIVI
uniref:GYF domain-containing protein n=1 Tax=Brassica oleracea var. oleracea TaxID=109376 RepID=A0A0D3D356_BRAOL